MMYDYNSIKSFWTKFYKDWAEDAKSYQEQVAEFWKDFLSKIKNNFIELQTNFAIKQF